MDWTRGALCEVRLLDACLVNSGAILTTFMMPDDNDHLEQNDHQVNLYKLIYIVYLEEPQVTQPPPRLIRPSVRLSVCLSVSP